MTKLIHSQAKDNYPLIALISQVAITKLNQLFDTHYTKGLVTQVTVKRDKRKEDNTKFFKKLMEEVPGFGKSDLR